MHMYTLPRIVNTHTHTLSLSFSHVYPSVKTWALLDRVHHGLFSCLEKLVMPEGNRTAYRLILKDAVKMAVETAPESIGTRFFKEIYFIIYCHYYYSPLLFSLPLRSLSLSLSLYMFFSSHLRPIALYPLSPPLHLRSTLYSIYLYILWSIWYAFCSYTFFSRLIIHLHTLHYHVHHYLYCITAVKRSLEPCLPFLATVCSDFAFCDLGNKATLPSYQARNLPVIFTYIYMYILRVNCVPIHIYI